MLDIKTKSRRTKLFLFIDGDLFIRLFRLPLLSLILHALSTLNSSSYPTRQIDWSGMKFNKFNKCERKTNKNPIRNGTNGGRRCPGLIIFVSPSFPMTEKRKGSPREKSIFSATHKPKPTRRKCDGKICKNSVETFCLLKQFALLKLKGPSRSTFMVRRKPIYDQSVSKQDGNCSTQATKESTKT